jgi:tellurite resistance protein
MSLSIDLTDLGPERLRAAVQVVLQGAPATLGGRLPTSMRLQQAARETLEHAGTDSMSPASIYFQSILEIGYLVASADGFADEERQTLAELLEQITGRAVPRDVLEVHFRDLDTAIEVLGRRERLRRAAADFEDGMARGEALGFAALVALADGMLAEPEASALREVGGHFGLSEAEIESAVGRIVDQLKSAVPG